MRAEEREVVKQALQIMARNLRRGRRLGSPEDTRRLLQVRLAGEKNEVFGAIFLTNRHAVIASEDLFYGTIDGASVHPRVVVQKAMGHNAAAAILAHFVPRNKMAIMRPVSLCATNV